MIDVPLGRDLKRARKRAGLTQADLRAGFDELWRVLRSGGVLTLKWNDATKSADSVLDILPETPLYGSNSTKVGTETNWWVFHKR